MPLPILTLITFAPLALALAVIALPARRSSWAMHVATWGCLANFFLSLVPLYLYDRNDGGFQFVETASWIPQLGAQYKLGVDGVSLLLVVLTTLLSFICMLSSWTSIQDRVKEYYATMLVLQVGMIGVFVALDLFLFYVFWEVMLVPMAFLIGIWGGARRLYAAVKFFLYTLFGSVLMLLGIVSLYFFADEKLGTRTFDIETLHLLGAHTPAWGTAGLFVFLAFFIGFAVKVPMFPFHTWLPDAHVEAPTAGSVILAGVLLKMGTYGFYRLTLPIFPKQTADHLWWLLSLCAIGIVYGAMVALVQQDWKKLVAYSSVSHLGMTMIGLFALNMSGVQGSVVQMINHGISTGALFLLIGIVYERRHTREFSEFGGLAKVMPVYAVFFLVMVLSSAGLPALNGFVGEIYILAGLAQMSGDAFSFFGYSPFIWVVLAATGLVLGAAYLLWMWQRTMWGPLTNDKNKDLADITWRERWTLIPLVVLAIGIGIYPKPLLDVVRAPLARLLHEQVEPVLRASGAGVDLPVRSSGAPGSGLLPSAVPAAAPTADPSVDRANR